ncbi:MAG: hypothetical protein V3T83_10650, partial [Acidobacteriota bacterium]
MKSRGKSSRPAVTVVGCGHWGRHLVRNFAQLDALASVCETDPSRQEAARGIAGRDVVTADFEEALDSS